MTKEKKILIYFISFILGLFTIMLVGIINVKADTYNSSQYTAKLYDNYGPNLSGVTTSLSNNSWRGTIPTMVANSAGAAWGISSPIVLLSNHTYTLTVQIEGSFGGNIVLSTYNRIGIGTSLSNAVTSYQNNTNATENYSRVLNDGVSIQFAFTPTTNGSYIVFPFATSSGGNDYQFVLTNIVIDDLGATGVSQSQITSSLDSQTNEINSSIENSTNTITDALTETEDNINNKIDETFQSCPEPVELSYSTGKKFTTTGELIEAEGFYYTENYYSFDSSHKITFKNTGSSTTGYIILYNSDKTVTGYYGVRDRTLYLPSAVYYRLSTNKADLQVYLGDGECTNKIDETNDKLDEAENTRKGMWETIKDLPNAFMNMLKGLFIPEDGYFENWFNDLKSFFEEKLGFLATPFTIIIDFVNRYLDLNPQDDIIINIPDITVPNFEEYIIIKATVFNWSETLRSKESLYMLWQLYLSFIDVYLILNFINLCENKYNRIFGGDVANYEYYTVEDSYNVDINTGEVKNMRRNERKTTRKKVN